MARFRLRFLLQELDLKGPEVVIGRSPDCTITLEDPLVSRQHASIEIEGDKASVKDLGSRNGVKVNGNAIDKNPHLLRDGDRIRIGTQELVFCVVRQLESRHSTRPPKAMRTTGFMRNCRSCGTPYPDAAVACPHCGAAAQAEEDTMSGLTLEPRRTWTFQLLGELIDRGLAAQRIADVDRILQRAAHEIDERQARAERLDVTQLATMSVYALRLASLATRHDWVTWVFSTHEKEGVMLAQPVLDILSSIAPTQELATAAARLVTAFRAKPRTGPTADLAGLARLEQWIARSR